MPGALGQFQQERKDMLRHRGRAVAGDIAHDDAPLARGVEIHDIHASRQ